MRKGWKCQRGGGRRDRYQLAQSLHDSDSTHIPSHPKPIGYRAAYGTDKHDDYYHKQGAKAQAGELLDYELAHLREELDAMAAKGTLTAELKVLRRDLEAATAAPTAPATAAAIAAKGGNA